MSGWHLSAVNHTDQHRRGAGSLFFEVCFSRELQRGAQEVFLEIRPFDIPAVKFYRKFGFDMIVKRHKNYRDSKEEALVMIKKLQEDT